MKIHKKRITQKEIAQRALIRPDFLSHIIRGRKSCPPRVAEQLEEVTGISRVVWVWGKSKEIRQAVEDFVYSDSDSHGN